MIVVHLPIYADELADENNVIKWTTVTLLAVWVKPWVIDKGSK